jgi:hypothetical protein
VTKQGVPMPSFHDFTNSFILYDILTNKDKLCKTYIPWAYKIIFKMHHYEIWGFD